MHHGVYIVRSVQSNQGRGKIEELLLADFFFQSKIEDIKGFADLY